jgi:hypothetical protein
MKTKLEDMQAVYDILTKGKSNQMGFILLPAIEGFKVFEVSEERLKLYLMSEQLHIKANKEDKKEGKKQWE